MAINPDLLISAAMLQDYLVDKSTGTPLAGGVVSLYRDNARTTFKTWYYQSGAPGAYTYVPLDNPLTLSGVGTITDPNGNDTIPFFYPYDESDNVTPQPYYITVDSATGTRQFTRQNFPFVPTQPSPFVNVPTLQNLIVNNVFWRNVGSLNVSSMTDAVIAPSQHDGFTMPDIRFVKNTTDATDTITFNQFIPNFADNILPSDVTPEYYLNLHCSSAGTETSKYVQIPIFLHVDNASGYTNASVVIQAMNVPGAANGTITLKLYNYLGAGVVSPTATTIQTITLTNSWQKYVIPFTFPSQQNSVLGAYDNAYFLQVGFPTALTCNINIAKPAVYLSDDVPTDDFETYDEVNAIISSPRTGDLRTSLNTFYPFGWVPMNGGTIGDEKSNATARANADTWPLYKLIWEAFSAYTSGSTNLLAQLVTSAGSNVAYGADAITDFNAHKAITLTKSMGEVLLGTAPIATLLAAYKNTFTASNSGGNLLLTSAANASIFNGMPFYVSNTGGALPTGLAANTIYYVSGFNGTTAFKVSTTFANAIAGTVIAYTDAGSGTNTFTSALAGSYEGEYSHTQTIAEMPSHDHPGSTALSDNGAGLGPYFKTSASQIQSNALSIAAQGGGAAFNITQPGTFYNIFMKL